MKKLAVLAIVVVVALVGVFVAVGVHLNQNATREALTTVVYSADQALVKESELKQEGYRIDRTEACWVTKGPQAIISLEITIYYSR